MTTESEPELTDTQKAYNVAQSNLFQLAAYGHHRYHPLVEALTNAGKAQQRDYNDRIRKAREELESAVLRLVAEHAETFRGDWGVPAAWLRSLADDPAELSLLAVRPDERDPGAAPVAAPPTGQGDAVDRAAVIRWCADKVRSTDSDYAVQQAAEYLDDLALEAQEERDEAQAQANLDALADLLPAPVDRAAVLREAATRYEEILANANTGQDPRYWTAVRDITLGLRRIADEAHQTDGLRRLATETPGPETQGAHDDGASDAEPGEEQIVREHVTTLHLIGEQLAAVESWMWAHLADVRATAPTAAHSCGNCEGIDPDSCLMNPDRPRTNLFARSGISTPGCDCGHDGMGVRWHGQACVWVGDLVAEARQLLAAEDTAPAVVAEPGKEG